MFFTLPIELQQYIYEYDSTYPEIYKFVMKELLIVRAMYCPEYVDQDMIFHPHMNHDEVS